MVSRLFTRRLPVVKTTAPGTGTVLGVTDASSPISLVVAPKDQELVVTIFAFGTAGSAAYLSFASDGIEDGDTANAFVIPVGKDDTQITIPARETVFAIADSGTVDISVSVTGRKCLCH